MSVRIFFTGPRGSGKTVLAQAIADVLKAAGVGVTLVKDRDDDRLLVDQSFDPVEFVSSNRAAAAMESLDIEQQALIGIRAAQQLAHKTATDAGWYRDPSTGEAISRNFGEVVSLMHSELSEALEADRKGLMDDKLPHRDGREVEFADCIIRILDTAAALGLDVAGALIEKNRYNKERADHKLANRAAGGKRY